MCGYRAGEGGVITSGRGAATMRREGRLATEGLGAAPWLTPL